MENDKIEIMEDEITKIKRKQGVYTAISAIMLFFVVVGVISSAVLEKPEGGVFDNLLLNIGTYGIGGISTVYLIVIIVACIALFIFGLKSTGFTLFGFVISAVGAALAFGLGFTVFEKIVTWLYGAIDTDFVISIFGMTVDGSKEIPVSGTIGGALLNTCIYTIPLVIVSIKALQYSVKLKKTFDK